MARPHLFLLAIAALMLPSPVLIQVWEMSPSGLQRVSSPGLCQPVQNDNHSDLDADGVPETLFLKSGKLEIRSGVKTRWVSPAAWIVQQAAIADLNRDAQPEAVLLVSRPFQPWPVDAWLPHGGRIESFQDAQGYSSHVLLIGWAGGKFRELWAGSALAHPVKSFAPASLGAKDTYLITLEGEYNDAPSRPARWLRVWEWNGFGFKLVSVLDGPFRGMAVSSAGERRFLILER